MTDEIIVIENTDNPEDESSEVSDEECPSDDYDEDGEGEFRIRFPSTLEGLRIINREWWADPTSHARSGADLWERTQVEMLTETKFDRDAVVELNRYVIVEKLQDGYIDPEFWEMDLPLKRMFRRQAPVMLSKQYEIKWSQRGWVNLIVSSEVANKIVRQWPDDYYIFTQHESDVIQIRAGNRLTQESFNERIDIEIVDIKQEPNEAEPNAGEPIIFYVIMAQYELGHDQPTPHCVHKLSMHEQANVRLLSIIDPVVGRSGQLIVDRLLQILRG